MKGCIPTGAQTGGDKGFAGKKVNVNARNIRRIMKKYPHDKVLQKILQEKLEKY